MEAREYVRGTEERKVKRRKEVIIISKIKEYKNNFFLKKELNRMWAKGHMSRECGYKANWLSGFSSAIDLSFYGSCVNNNVTNSARVMTSEWLF